MLSGKRIEQLILTRSAGAFEALVVTESPSGARQRERWPALASDVETAIDRLAKQLARRGDIDGLRSKVRIRIERGEELIERPDLAVRLRAHFDRDRL